MLNYQVHVVARSSAQPHALDSSTFGFHSIENSDTSCFTNCSSNLCVIPKAFYRLTQFFPAYAASSLKKLLNRQREKQTLKSNRRRFPEINSFLLLRLIPGLFSVSDFHHPVGVPALLYATDILKRVQVRGPIGVAKGLLLSAVLLEYVVQSKRYIPEVMGFLRGVFHVAIDHGKLERAPTKSFPLSSPEDKMLHITRKVESDTMEKIDLRAIFAAEEDLESPVSDTFKESCISTCLNLVEAFSSIYRELPSSAEIFSPFITSLERLPVECFSQKLAASVTCAVSSLQANISKQNKPELKVETVKGKEFKFLEPRVELGFNPERSRKIVGPKKGPKAERKKLIHQLKKETRGAMRELRRDSQFLAREKLKERMERDMDRKRKTKEIMKGLQSQQGEAALETRKKMRNK